MGQDLEQRVHFSCGEDEEEEILESDSFSSDSDDCEEDATPPSKASSLPLYELSSPLEQLPPIKKGLSKYYPGKSQSYTSLSIVSSLEDLPKKETPYNRRKMETCNSCAGGLVANGVSWAPSCASFLMSKSSRSGLLQGGMPPSLPVKKIP